MSTCETGYFKMCNGLFQKSEIYYSKKCAIEIDVIFVKQASKKWNVGFELWNNKYRKWNCNVSLWNCVFLEMCNNLFQKSEIGDLENVQLKYMSFLWNKVVKSEM